jgi:hypothetical protein
MSVVSILFRKKFPSNQKTIPVIPVKAAHLEQNPLINIRINLLNRVHSTGISQFIEEKNRIWFLKQSNE